MTNGNERMGRRKLWQPNLQTTIQNVRLVKAREYFICGGRVSYAISRSLARSLTHSTRCLLPQFFSSLMKTNICFVQLISLSWINSVVWPVITGPYSGRCVCVRFVDFSAVSERVYYMCVFVGACEQRIPFIFGLFLFPIENGWNQCECGTAMHYSHSHCPQKRRSEMKEEKRWQRTTNFSLIK